MNAPLVMELADTLKEIRKWMDADVCGPWDAKFTTQIDVVLAKTVLAQAADHREELINALTDCADYFDGCSDADFDGDTFVANKEMRLKMMIEEVLKQVGAA